MVRAYGVQIFAMVNVLQFRTSKFMIKWYVQTVQTQIRENSDQGVHCLPFQ